MKTSVSLRAPPRADGAVQIQDSLTSGCCPFRHDLHRRDPKTVFFSKTRKEFLTVFIRPCSQYFTPVAGTPDDMVLERADISTTIR